MSGTRLEKTGGVFIGIRREFFRDEHTADASKSFAPVDGITRRDSLRSNEPARTAR